MDKPLRVLFFSHEADLVGGAQRSLLTLLENIDRHLVDPTVVAPGEGELTEALRSLDIPVIRTNPGRWIIKRQSHLRNGLKAIVFSLRIAQSYFSLRRQIQTDSFDLVYTNTLVSPVGALIAEHIGCPHIWHVREFVQVGLGAEYSWGKQRSMRFINRTTTKVISNSKALEQHMTQYIATSKSIVIHNGFPELDNLHPNPKHQPISHKRPLQLGIVGSIMPHKRQLDTVQALHLLIQEGIDAELLIAGNGSTEYIDQIKWLAKELNISERIIWKGYIENVAELYQQLDILLICSVSEAFGRTAIEALAHGCPVVGTNSGGLPEIITHGENGFLYEVGDVKALSEKISHLIQKPDLYHRMSSQAYSSIYPRFSVAQYVNNVTQVIQQEIQDWSNNTP